MSELYLQNLPLVCLCNVLSLETLKKMNVFISTLKRRERQVDGCNNFGCILYFGNIKI